MQDGVIAAVIGFPVSHSLSPAMYRSVFEAHQVDGEYIALECSQDDVAKVIEQARVHGLCGLSVTMPLKEVIIAELDFVDEVAQILRAVNCVVIKDGRANGYNTDGDGCCDALEQQGGATLSGCEAVVLGAGGTGRSVALALGLRGAHVVVINRTESKTTQMIHEISPLVVKAGGTIRSGTFEDIVRSTIVVNTTSVGMNSQNMPIPDSLLRPHHIVLDAVYQPMETSLLRAVAKVGGKGIDGLWMLVQQARRQCVLQFGWNPDVAAMRAAAERELRARRQ